MCNRNKWAFLQNNIVVHARSGDVTTQRRGAILVKKVGKHCFKRRRI